MSDQSHKIAYNIATSQKWGWEPSWFDASGFNDELIDKVRAFQKAHGLEADGLVGSMTYRRIWTERESMIDELEPMRPATPQDGGYIVRNLEFVPIEWNDVVLWTGVGGKDNEEGNRLPEGCFTNMAGEPEREIRMGVTHWDVCLTSESCFKVLSQRGVSVHFGIDYDGTIHQWLDMQHIAWHASDRDTNKYSVGVEICNPYYLKYQDWYVKRGLGERPTVENAKVHGGILEPHLGFYPIQLKALKALWEAVATCGVPLQTPDSTTVVPGVAEGVYHGFVHHYQVLRKKIDCGGVDLAEVLGL